MGTTPETAEAKLAYVRLADGTLYKIGGGGGGGSGSGGPPSGAAGGDLSGTYPDPQIAAGAIVDADVNASAAIAQSKIANLTTDLTSKLTQATADTLYLQLAGGTLTGGLGTVASATGGAGLKVPHGAAPTSPVNGDVWTTTIGMYARINGVTVGPLAGGGGGYFGTWDNATAYPAKATVYYQDGEWGATAGAPAGETPVDPVVAGVLPVGADLIANAPNVYVLTDNTSASSPTFDCSTFGTEAGEPGGSGGSKSAWWRYTPTVGGTGMTVNLSGSDGDVQMYVYRLTTGTFSTFADLTQVDVQDSGSVTFTPTAAATYYFKAGSWSGTTVYKLNLVNARQALPAYSWKRLSIDKAAADARYLQLTGGTLTGFVGTVASATGGAGLRVPHGTAPTSPVDGDVWTATTGIYARINGVTVGPLGTSGLTQTAADVRYLQLTGGTVSGNVTIQNGLYGNSPLNGSDYACVQAGNAHILLGVSTDKNAYIIGRHAASQVYLRPGNTSAGQLVVDPTYTLVSSPQLILDQAAGTTSALAFMVGASLRWTFTRSAGTEPGSNVGSDFYFGRYSDAGAWIDNPLTINRANGTVVLGQGLLLAASTTARASVRISHGTAPTSPVNGDMWTTSADGLQVRVNGVTYPQAGVVVGGTKPTSPPVGTVWMPSGSTVQARSYAVNVASGTTVVVTHNLATTDVVVAVYRLSDGLEVDVPFSRTSTNAVTLNSAVDLTGHRVVVLAAGG